MNFGVSIRLYDTLMTLQGVQQVAIIAALLTVGYLIYRKKSLTDGLKLWFWGLAAAWTIASVGLYGYSLHNYVKYSRPAFRKENMSQTGL